MSAEHARLGEPARHLGTVGSTMTEAARWAREGAPHGALVTAERQTAGRGRHGRRWTDDGRSLLLTLVLRPGLHPDRLGLVPLAAGLAVAETAEALGVSARLKWPNDVRVSGRKLAGVLAESTHGASTTVLLGVGLNVGQMGFPEDLRATSLALEAGRPIDRREPLDRLLDRLGHRLDQTEADGAGLLAEVEARMEALGESVTVRDPASGRVLAEGTIRGLEPDGALCVLTATGPRAVHAGEVTLAAP